MSRVANIFFTVLTGAIFLYFVSCKETTIAPVSFGSLSGTVIDNFNNLPLEGVEINTNPSSSVVFSDSLGNFSVEQIATGDYSFTANLNGYEKTFVNATIVTGVNTQVSFKMDRQVILPDPAINPQPVSGATDQPRNITLTWDSTIPNNDSLTYDVFIYESNVDSAIIASLNKADTFLIPVDLRYETTYFWQVNVKSSTGGETKGAVWSFRTLDFPDNPFTFTSNKTGNFQIYSSNDSSDQSIQITRTSFNSLHPLMNNNRKEIAFASNPSLDYQITLMDFNGDNKRQITTIPIAGFHNNGVGFCWWPDNGGFIYSHYENLYSIDRNGSNLTLISQALANRNFRSCDYSGATDKIVVQTIGSLIYQGEIYLMNSDGSDTVRIVDDLPGIIENPTFSIDGKQVMYTRDASGFNAQNGRQLDARIYILDLTSMAEVDVSGNKAAGTNDLQPRFSPNGAQIIFVNTSNEGDKSKSVYVMDVDGGNRTLLFEDAEMPGWQ